ncbi:MAG TPA: pantoate--beta-alanine ligase [Bacilli bacterium]|nr:pantoate--beta-alanine ligase [Bacilli bacterium]
MQIISNIAELKETVKQYKQQGKSLGLVPTMGFLHEGHLSLIEKARKQNDLVVISIFVNPLQFGPNEDFDRYPRDFERDEALAKQAGVDIVFYPSVEEMYPTPMAMNIIVTEGVNVLCGKSRPGHFDGVATVVMKLFQIVLPDRAYFGMKDAQQVAVIEKMIRDFNLSIELVRCPTLREEDGLAKSSRNVYLSEAERAEAPAIYRSLQQGLALIVKGERSRQAVIDEVRRHLEANIHAEIDYIEVLSYPQLVSAEQISGEVMIAAAVKYEKARLIDNMIVNLDSDTNVG